MSQAARPVRDPVAVYLTRNLTTGGAERVFVSYVNHAQTISPVVALLERSGGLLGELRSDVQCFARVNRTVPLSRAAKSAVEIPGESFARLALECLWLRDVVRRSGALVVSSFLMRAHIVALLTRMTLLPRVHLVLNVHEHMTESAPFLYPLARDRAMMRWICRHLFPRADRIVVVAEELKRDLTESHGVPSAMIEVVHNPVDTEGIRVAAAVPLEPQWARPNGRSMIVAVGRLVPLKGYDLLLHAVAKLRSTRDVGLLVIGEGEERGKLEELAGRLGVADVVTFAGERDNPWRFVARADVFALTSRTEAFPSVLSEAMALGIPVLATDCSAGVRECLRDGVCGLIVPSGDVDAIAQGLDRLLGEQEAGLRASFIAAGYARVASFELLAVQRRYESVLAGLIAARST